MPEMDGAEVFQKVRQMNPSQPILLISGYVQNDLVKSLLDEDHSRFLAKPFRATDLLKLVSALSDEEMLQKMEPLDATRSVLLVEDDALLSELTASALRDYGYAVAAGTAQAAVKLFESGEYDIVLLDLGLPDACGTEVALNIRTQKKWH